RAILERNRDFQFVRLAQLPSSLDIATLSILNADVVHANGALALQMKNVFAAHNQRALLRGRNRPTSRTRRAQRKIGAAVRLKTPKTTQRAGEFWSKLGRIGRMSINNEATARSIRHRRQIDFTAILGWDAKRKIMGNIRGENQRRTLDRQHQGGFLQAKDLLGVHRAQ